MSNKNQDFLTGGRPSGSLSEDPTSTPQVILQASHSGDLALAVRHEFQPQVPTGRPQALGMQEREVSCSTSYPVCPSHRFNRETEAEQIKVKMPNGTNFGMAAFTYGTKEDYLAHVIAVLQNIEKKGLASEIKVAWDAILKVRREMKPCFQFPKDKTEAAKEIQKQMLSKYKEILKAKKVFMVAKTQKAFEMF